MLFLPAYPYKFINKQSKRIDSRLVDYFSNIWKWQTSEEDSLLNEVWDILADTMQVDEFERLLEEQRAWIKKKMQIMKRLMEMLTQKID